MKTKIVIGAATVAFVVAAIVVGVAVMSPTSPAKATGPQVVSSLPSVIPPDGVRIEPQSSDVTLMPPAGVDLGSLKLSTPAQAIAEYNDHTPTSPTVVLAKVTIGASLPVAGDAGTWNPIVDRVCWVLCYTYAKPVSINYGPPPVPGVPTPTTSPQLYSHDTVIIDASTGEFLWGWNSP